MSEHTSFEEFNRILEALSSPDNIIRAKADERLTYLKNNDLNNTVLHILNILQSEKNADRRLQAAVLLRLSLDTQKISMIAMKTWQNVDDSVKNSVKNTLINALHYEMHARVRSNVCDTICDLCTNSLVSNEWPELAQCALQLAHNDQPIKLKTGLKLIGDCYEYFSDQIDQHVESLTNILKNSLVVNDVQIVSEAITTISSILTQDSTVLADSIRTTAPLIIQALDKLLLPQEGRDAISPEEGERVMASIVILIDSNTNFLKNNLQHFTHKMMSIALGDGPFAHLDSGIRCLAIEALITIPEKKPKLALSSPNFIPHLIECLIRVMLDIESEIYAEWLESDVDEQDGCQRLYDAGEEGLDRLGRALQYSDDSRFMTWLLSSAAQYINQPTWPHKFVGIMAISQTIEYLDEDEAEERLGPIFKILLEKLKDPDYRVRFAACQAIGQIALDHQPFVQLSFFKEVLPTLINAFDDNSIRVQSHASSAFINFAEEVQKENLLPYADIIVQKLLGKININTPRLVREQAITAIAVTAGVLEEHFFKYYNAITPLMKEIIVKCTSRDDRTCRGKAIECISIIGMSIGKDIFHNDGIECMNALLQIMQEPMESDDPVKEYCDEALGRLCRALGQNFVPFLPNVVPLLLKVLEPNFDSNVNADDDMTIMLTNGEAMGLKTSQVEEQQRTLDLLSNIVDELKDSYGPYISITAKAIMPILSYIITYEIKEKALNVMSLLIAAQIGVYNKTGQGREFLLDMVVNTVNHVVSNIEKARNENCELEVPIEILSAEVSGLHKCVDSAGPGLLNENMITVFCKKLLILVEKSTKIKALYAEQMKNEDLDQDDLLKLQDDEEAEQGFRSAVLEIFSALMKHYPDEFLKCCHTDCMNFIRTYLSSESCDDKSVALYMCDDMLENLQARVVPYWDHFLPSIMANIEIKETSIRQAACYGVIQASKMPEFAQYASNAAKSLANSIRTYSSKRSKSHQAANDNAVAALGDIIRKFGNNIYGIQDYLTLWMNNLPLKSDEEEGKRVHTDVMELILQKNPSILGVENANLPKLVKMFIKIYETPFSTQTLNSKIVYLMKHLGDVFLNELLPSMTKKEQVQLELIIRVINSKGNDM